MAPSRGEPRPRQLAGRRAGFGPGEDALRGSDGGRIRPAVGEVGIELALR
jgi:hypothetical protein